LGRWRTPEHIKPILVANVRGGPLLVVGQLGVGFLSGREPTALRLGKVRGGWRLRTGDVLRGGEGFGGRSTAQVLTDCVGGVLKNFGQLPNSSLPEADDLEKR
jgi:hypothetical protein